jgi:transmembrane sensor
VLHDIDPEREQDVDALVREFLASAPGSSASISRIPEHAHAGLSGRRGRIAASLALTAAAGLAAFLVLIPAQPRTLYTTAQGEQRSVQLPDKSLVTLNVDSQIEVKMNARTRMIHLVRGEALFNVAPDAGRPFVVEASGASVRALGTQFNVHNVATGARVSVLDGRVRLEPLPGSASPGTPAILAAGDEADISNAGAIARTPQPDIAKSLAWRERELIFDNTSLEDIISEFNRYNAAVRLVVQDVPAHTYHYSGVFDATDPESLVALLSAERDFRIERQGSTILIRLVPKDSAVR